MSNYKLSKRGEQIATVLGWAVMIAASLFVIAVLAAGFAWLVRGIL